MADGRTFRDEDQRLISEARPIVDAVDALVNSVCYQVVLKGKDMSDNLLYRGSPDTLRINVHEQWEASSWARKFGVTVTELVDAVRAVGTYAKDVEAYLIKQRASRNRPRGLLG